MITRLYIDNFRTLVNCEVKLDRLNLLMGENGSGKSSIFDVLRKIQTFSRGDGKIDRIFDFRDCTRWQSQPIQRFEIDVQLPQGDMQYLLVVEFNEGEEKCRVQEEFLRENEKPLFERNYDTVQLYRDNHSKGPTYPFDWTHSALATIQPRHDNQKLTAFKNFIDRLVIVAINPFGIETDSRKEEASLHREMVNFASWYRKRNQDNMGALIKLFRELKAVLPGFETFSFKDAGQDTKTFNVEFSGFGGKKLSRFFFSELSDGQRVLIVLYTLIYGIQEDGRCLFLDEPDNFVSLREIQPLLTSIQDEIGKEFSQAVIISHHPEIINSLGDARGRWFSRDEGGHTRVKESIPTDGEGISLSEIIARGWQE